MTKKLFFLLPILLTAFSISAQTRTDKLLKNLHDNESKYIFVIAHRGDWRNAPENSLQSIEKAIAMKVDMIELDIQPTKDGNFICMHDETLDRTSTGKGPIKDYTTEELKKFVLRSGNGIKTRQIPTLKEALNVCKGRILVNIDKGGTYIKEIMPIIQECGMEKQVIIKGYYPVEKVKKEYGSNESMLYMPIVNLWDKEAVATIQTFIKNFTPIAYELCFKDDANPNLKIIDEIAKSGSRIWMNTLWDSLCGGHDDENALLESKDKHWGWMLKHKATMIQTDRPQELIHYLEEKGLRDLEQSSL
ncbi:glycerophosphodiester phosphodiesterase family protein [Bacteroides ovatus]|uniref:glycerophosphodiester phosphodiesterase family protein n=1 Tax=Bacteroides ovatus TaxID=28116 RepID=UPI002FEE4469